MESNLEGVDSPGQDSGPESEKGSQESLGIVLFTRDDCSLCDQAVADLASLEEEFPHTLSIIDVDRDPALLEKYSDSVPVLQVGPYVKHAPFTRDELRVTLMAARDRISQLERLEDPVYLRRKEKGRTITRTDRLSYFLTSHYLKGLILLIGIYLSLPFLAPVLMNAGATVPASVIYRLYGAVCHQFAFRSWFLYGEQYAYPREAANVERLVSYEEATGMDGTDIFASRAYVGEEGIGYKVAFCQRDVAIYAGVLFFCLIFAASGHRLRSLPWYFWILLGVAPIALDGLSQLLSQPPFEFWDYRESTPFLRSLTGFLFGFSTAWFGIPMIEQAMRDTRRVLTVKFSKAAG
jgi:uncharacterized membrane protein